MTLDLMAEDRVAVVIDAAPLYEITPLVNHQAEFLRVAYFAV
jgi:hypothetical protein